MIGKVKTRLAQSIGTFNACKIYVDLLHRTHKSVVSLPISKVVFYSDFIDDNDLWENNKFGKFLQKGTSIGERMHNALQSGLRIGYNKVVLIGGDVPSLTSSIIETAFNKLEETDTVFGPAKDGGYYLIGMKKDYPELFENVDWGTDAVLNQTLKNCNSTKLSYSLLAELVDLDTFADIKLLKPFFAQHFLKLTGINQESNKSQLTIKQAVFN
ncbi:MAG: TIGR04282 family arsenosugar biosynthesis glycosyltransferase [Bacteroidales bacterium]|nr:TIGR04282 family arsenosugar biosynthesis glycosyltransferase [Bacteroidales bacterium]MCF8404855.1 TIGR04282 family arsenosugar biosynthesis glycosyltransferase [Bacteroidales bacterium]